MDWHNKRILLVEDDRFSQILMTRLISKLNISVDLAVNGSKAVETCSVTSYDLILMDCNLPELDGYQSTRKIREIENSQGRVESKIIAATSDEPSEVREKCLLSGMNDVVKKPISEELLLGIMTKWLDGAPSVISIPIEMKTALETIQKLKPSGQDDLLLQLIDIFLEEVHNINLWIDSASRNGDFLRISDALHRLKSSCRTFGAGQAGQACEEVESAAKKKDKESVMSKLPLLKIKLNEVVVQVSHFKNSTSQKAE